MKQTNDIPLHANSDGSILVVVQSLALNWCKYFLKFRHSQLTLEDTADVITVDAVMTFGVPQRSMLEPVVLLLLFSFLPLSQIIINIIFNYSAKAKQSCGQEYLAAQNISKLHVF